MSRNGGVVESAASASFSAIMPNTPTGSQRLLFNYNAGGILSFRYVLLLALIVYHHLLTIAW